MLFQWSLLLLLIHFLSDCQSLECDRTQYEWPNNNPTWCCKKCKPGQYMKDRCTKSLSTECSPCGKDFYMDDFNVEFQCKRCSECIKANMEPKQSCTTNNNTVCGCKSGFKCNNDQCDQCVKIPPPPPPPTTTTTTATTTTKQKPTTFQDSVWISLSLSLCCVCILLTCFILISRHTPAYGWAVSASSDHCFWHPKKSSANSSNCTKEEDVPMPVQEVCGGKGCQEEV